MNFVRTKAIAKKEFKHLFRDIRMLLILLFFPVFLLGIFGYAVNFDVKNIKTTVYDSDRTELSRNFINSLSSSGYFNITKFIDSDTEIRKILDKKDAQLVIVIPKNLSRDFHSNKEAKIQYLIDGVDGNTASLIQNYVTAATSSYNNKLTLIKVSKTGSKFYTPVDYQPIFWFNPELKSTKFLIPGLIVMILIVTSAVSVSLSLVREKERGTIEQVDVSPVKSGELIIGKTTPYIVLALFNAIVILVVGYILFDVEVKGSYLLLFITTSIFLFASTSLGILVSVISDSQQVAFNISTMASLLPSVILSGFIFPIDSMPWAVQIFTNLTPAKFFIEILRAIVLKGVGLQDFYLQVIYLIIFATVFLGLANLINSRKGKTS
jgi:ABC-2 type transport system permease protein